MTELTNQEVQLGGLEDIGGRSSEESFAVYHDIEETAMVEPNSDLREAWQQYGVIKLEDLVLGLAVAIITATVVLLGLVFTKVMLGLMRLLGVVRG